VPAVFVLSAWAALTIAGVLYVSHFGLTSPYADEWRWTEQLVGAAPVDVAWLCQAENGHRVPLYKLVYLAVLRAGGYDYRSTALASVLLLSAASLAVLLAARRLRGRWDWTDVVLPALLLNWSQAINLVWGFQLFYVLPISLVLFFLATVCFWGRRLPLVASIALALIVCCLPGCGGPGICCLPPLAFGLALTAAGRCTTGPTWQRAVSGLVCLAAAASLASVPLYFSSALGGASAASSAPPLDLRRAAVSTVQVLSMSMGRLAEDLWPVSGAAVVACATFVALRLALIAWRGRVAVILSAAKNLARRHVGMLRCAQDDSRCTHDHSYADHQAQLDSERLRALGLLTVIAAIVMLAAGIGATRWHFGYDYCFARRYITLSAPLLAALYLTVVRYGRISLRPWVRCVVVVFVLVVLATYQRNGWSHAADLSALVQRLERNAQEGLPPATVAVRCWADAQCEPPRLTACLALLHRARIGPYRNAMPTDDAGAQATPVAVVPIGPAGARVAAGHRPLLADTWLRLPIPGDGSLVGIDLRLRRGLRDAAAPTLHWQIAAVDSAGQRTELRCGTADPRMEADPVFVRLRFSPVDLPPGAQFELGLRNASSRSGRLPLFVAADVPLPSPQGFAFFR
jgi:hypothetical protein